MAEFRESKRAVDASKAGRLRSHWPSAPVADWGSSRAGPAPVSQTAMMQLATSTSASTLSPMSHVSCPQHPMASAASYINSLCRRGQHTPAPKRDSSPRPRPQEPIYDSHFAAPPNGGNHQPLERSFAQSREFGEHGEAPALAAASKFMASSDSAQFVVAIEPVGCVPQLGRCQPPRRTARDELEVDAGCGHMLLPEPKPVPVVSPVSEFREQAKAHLIDGAVQAISPSSIATCTSSFPEKTRDFMSGSYNGVDVTLPTKQHLELPHSRPLCRDVRNPVIDENVTLLCAPSVDVAPITAPRLHAQVRDAPLSRIESLSVSSLDRSRRDSWDGDSSAHTASFYQQLLRDAEAASMEQPFAWPVCADSCEKWDPRTRREAACLDQHAFAGSSQRGCDKEKCAGAASSVASAQPVPGPQHDEMVQEFEKACAALGDELHVLSANLRWAGSALLA